ncbi:hypothetical protein [Modestobacter sp. Leaf380]|uniref:hypothetical protein n=1 Tax=Modestobacter sp. Leaf380 TaxID=1736356 RepID=UPI0006F6F6C2|nr:hypothetical protein [Modestobacter sp. Leaf380]KQS68435.1 hypothetical protein ASG41_05475 [Modestobacter sp. Leaf380]
MIVSAVALVAAVACYGVAGARLSDGAREAGPTLRSRAWWTGTALQAGGFGTSAVARADLPLLVVQCAVVAALAVTAVLQQLAGVRRPTRTDAPALVATVAGLGLLVAATVPGPAVSGGTALLVGLAAAVVLALVAVGVPAGTWVSGALAGIGFSVGAVGVRALVSRLPDAWWRFWDLPGELWLLGVLTAAGMVLGQLHLTRGLAAAPAVPVLAVMYVVSTLLPAAAGHWLLDERTRAGWAPAAVAGAVLALVGALSLLRGERSRSPA